MDDVQSRAAPDQADPMESTLPEYAFQTAATELCGIQGKTYLVVVDYCSCYFEVAKLKKDTKASTVIKY